MAPDELTIEKAGELFKEDSGPKQVGTQPDTGRAVYAKVGRFGPYVQLGENDQEPKMKSLLPGMKLEELTLEDALRLLSLPRSLGNDPESGEEIFADFGRFGPYVKRASESRSLGAADEVFEVKLDRALALFKEEKKASWKSRGPKVLRELGEHPESKAPVKLLSGRYGPYVTDGTTNASLGRGASADDLTLAQAVELIRAREAAGPSKKRAKKVKKPKKATKKASKKATKKSSARTSGAKKSAAKPAKKAVASSQESSSADATAS